MKYYFIGVIIALFIASPLLVLPPVEYNVIPECVELECNPYE